MEPAAAPAIPSALDGRALRTAVGAAAIAKLAVGAFGAEEVALGDGGGGGGEGGSGGGGEEEGCCEEGGGG